MQLFDHTEPHFLSKIKEYTGTTQLINGASLYSSDLIKYQIPYWQKVLKEGDVISTCPLLYHTQLEGKYRNIVQYLHTYGFDKPVEDIKNNLSKCNFSYDNIIFITAYKAFETELKASGLKAVYIPMSIDVKDVQQYSTPKIRDNAIIYFGNIAPDKLTTFFKLREKCQSLGLQFDQISYSVFNDNKVLLTREEVLTLISSYKYGIGVGKCAQEMFALGLKVLIAGRSVGGIITCELELQKQFETNMNGRVVTFSSDIDECLVNLDYTISGTNDITKLNHVKEVRTQYQIF